MTQPRLDSSQNSLLSTRVHGVRGWPVETKIKIGVGLILGVLFVIGMILLWGRIRHTASIKKEEQTIQSIQTLEKLENLILTIGKLDTRERNPVSTEADRDNLEQYRVMSVSVKTTMKNLRRLTAEHPRLRRQFSTLESLIAKRLTLFQETMTVRMRKGGEATLRMIQADQVQTLTDSIRSMINEIEDEAQEMVEQQHKSMIAEFQQTTLIVVFVSFLAVSLIVLASVSLYHDVTMSRRVEETLRQARDELDYRVQERTAALVRVNEELQAEIVRRKQAEEELQGRVAELERFNRLAVGRELKMIELKQRIQELEAEKGTSA